MLYYSDIISNRKVDALEKDMEILQIKQLEFFLFCTVVTIQ